MANKLQRKVNGIIRRVNKAWTKDELLHGRFIIRQVQAAKLGNVSYYRFNISDVKSGDTKETHWLSQYDFMGGYIPFDMFSIFNTFIVRQLHKY